MLGTNRMILIWSYKRKCLLSVNSKSVRSDASWSLGCLCRVLWWVLWLSSQVIFIFFPGKNCFPLVRWITYTIQAMYTLSMYRYLHVAFIYIGLSFCDTLDKKGWGNHCPHNNKWLPNKTYYFSTSIKAQLASFWTQLDIDITKSNTGDLLAREGRASEGAGSTISDVPTWSRPMVCGCPEWDPCRFSNCARKDSTRLCKIYVSMELITPRCRLRSLNRRIPFWWRIGRRWLSDTSEPHTHLTISKWLSTHSLSLSQARSQRQ